MIKFIFIIAALFVFTIFFGFLPNVSDKVFEQQYARPSGCEKAYEKISKADVFGKFTFAYFEYCKVGAPPDKQYIEIILRSVALSFDTEVNNKILKDIQNTGVDLPEFFEMAYNALEWAETEKAKDAEELYKISLQVPDAALRHNYSESYRIPYLLLAQKKGHAQAVKDIEILGQELIERAEAIRKELNSAP